MMKMSRAGLVVMVALSIVLGACERSEVNGIGSNTPSDESPPQLDLVGQTDCTAGEWGWVSGEGELRNEGMDVSTYEVVVGFYDDDRRLADANTWIRDVDPGETVRFEALVWLHDDADSMTSCEVLTINRWPLRTEG